MTRSEGADRVEEHRLLGYSAVRRASFVAVPCFPGPPDNPGVEMHNARSRGFTLIEVLIVVGIIGILVAMAVINYTAAMNKARSKKTMADIRTIAAAWEARATDVRGYNAAGAFSYPAAPINSFMLRSMLVPNYARELPMKDAWGTPFEFAVDQAPGAGAAIYYAIRSAGSDREFETDPYEPEQTSDFKRDLVFSNGTFIVYPQN